MSFIYNRKRSGPNIDPCGTPDFIERVSDLRFFTLINCFLFDRYDLSNLTAKSEKW